jgi:RNA polymerase sigma factor (sigma-70 family)
MFPWSHIPLNRLLTDARKGDKKAEDQVFALLYERFRVFATHTIGATDAHDIATVACRIVLEKYRTEVFTKGFDEWSYGVLQNVIRNHLRTKGIHDKVMTSIEETKSEQGASPERDHEMKITLLDCMKRILSTNPRYAKVLTMIVQGYHAEEIAEKFNITVNNLYVVLNRSRAMLKRCLETGRV